MALQTGPSAPIGETPPVMICWDGKADGTRRTPPGGHPTRRGVPRILTNLPEKIPVLTGEIALLETYWAAILDVMAANDNEAD